MTYLNINTSSCPAPWDAVILDSGSTSFPILSFHPSYILWFYYTTDGETAALIVGALRAQVRRVEVQVPSVGIRVDLRPPVVAAATSIAEITATVIEVASAEEGEGRQQQKALRSATLLVNIL